MQHIRGRPRGVAAQYITLTFEAAAIAALVGFLIKSNSAKGSPETSPNAVAQAISQQRKSVDIELQRSKKKINNILELDRAGSRKHKALRFRRVQLLSLNGSFSFTL